MYSKYKKNLNSIDFYMLLMIHSSNNNNHKYSIPVIEEIEGKDSIKSHFFIFLIIDLNLMKFIHFFHIVMFKNLILLVNILFLMLKSGLSFF